jgi:hypothetical protein
LVGRGHPGDDNLACEPRLLHRFSHLGKRDHRRNDDRIELTPVLANQVLGGAERFRGFVLPIPDVDQLHLRVLRLHLRLHGGDPRVLAERSGIRAHNGEARARPCLFGDHVDERCPCLCEGPLVHKPLMRGGIGYVAVIGDDLDPRGLRLLGHGHHGIGVTGRYDDGIRLLRYQVIDHADLFVGIRGARTGVEKVDVRPLPLQLGTASLAPFSVAAK